MEIDRVVQRLATVGGKLRVRSALNPILWLCAVLSLPGLLILTVVESLPTWAIVIVSLPPIVACLAFLILLFKDSDKLQSEEYQINKQMLELAQEKDMTVGSIFELGRLTRNPDGSSGDDGQEEQ